MTDNYYKELWTDPSGEGTKFFKNVDFGSNKDYRYQEHIIKETLVNLKNMVKNSGSKQGKRPPIRRILEVGAGTGRITKIVKEIFSDTMEEYKAIEINKDNINSALIDMGTEEFHKIDWVHEDFIDYLVLTDGMFEDHYDLIIASEVFMHIKPEHIEFVVQKLRRTLCSGGYLLNVDWSFQEEQESKWCFIHNYERLYEQNMLYLVNKYDLEDIKQKLFCYQKK